MRPTTCLAALSLSLLFPACTKPTWTEDTATDDKSSSGSSSKDDSEESETATEGSEETTEASGTSEETESATTESDASNEETAVSVEPSPSESEAPEPSAGSDEVTDDSATATETTASSDDTEPPKDPPKAGEDVEVDVTQPEGTVPVVLALNTGWETLMSCDDGVTWTSGRALPGGECAGGATECDHDPGKGTGLAYTNGWFVGTFGNVPGEPAQIRRTNDGINWEQVGDQMSAGVAVGAGGRLVVARQPALYSDDDGATWQEGEYFETIPPIGNQRRIDYVPYDGGRYLTYFESNGVLDVAVSSDGGLTFHSSGSYPQDCRVADVEYINGVIIIANDANFSGVGGVICRSDDGGESWTTHELIPEGATERTEPAALFNTDTEVIAFGTNGVGAFTTTDGANWAQTSFNLNGFRHPMSTNARTLTGAFVSLMASDSPKLGRSADALEWAASESTWSGYLGRMVPGYVPASSCP